MNVRVSRLWLFWIAIVWFVSFPWIGFTVHPQWQRVHYVPFSDPADKFRDITANVLLFLPFGYSLTRNRPGARGLVRAAGLAVVVSVAAEGMQLFSTRRYPSATDAAAAVIGALAGGAATLWIRWRSKPETWSD